MNPAHIRWLPVLGILMAPLCNANPVFFVDTPALLRQAEEAVYAEHPDIAESGLVVARDAISFSCMPGRKRLRQNEAASQCLEHPYVAVPCKASVRLMVRSSVTQQVSALRNGRCRFDTTYRPVIVDFFQDGATEVRRPGFDFDAGRVGDCDIDVSPDEIGALAQHHEAILAREFSEQEIARGDGTITHPHGYFEVDVERLFRVAQESTEWAAEKGDLRLRESDLSFYCDADIAWAATNPVTLLIPSQQQSTSLCHTEVIFTGGERTVEKLAGDKGCSARNSGGGFLVRVFSDGGTEVSPVAAGGYRQGSCNSVADAPSVEEAIARYREQAAIQ